MRLSRLLLLPPKPEPDGPVAAQNGTLEYRFSSDYPALRVNGILRVYRFVDGELATASEAEADELLAVSRSSPYLIRFDGHCLRDADGR